MCHWNWRERERWSEERRGERLWDLFYRETEQSPPPVPIAERDAERSAEAERDEVPAGAKR